MPLHATDSDTALRLALTMLAGGLIDFNRGRHGHEAGLRTTMLVALAAAVAMVQANLLLLSEGKTAASFVTLDLMRLPLGILTRVSFIGGGAILKHGDFVTGLTTAATLWLTTVIGLCFGGGQFGLGLAATERGVAISWLVKVVDERIPREQRALLVLLGRDDRPTPPDLNEVCTDVGSGRTSAPGLNG